MKTNSPRTLLSDIAVAAKENIISHSWDEWSKSHLLATSTKLNKSGKLEPSASAVHSTWRYTNRWQFAAPHRRVTCGGAGTGTAPHENGSPWEQGPLQPARTWRQPLWMRARSQLHSCICTTGVSPLSKSSRQAESTGASFYNPHKLFILEPVGKEMTSARLACKAEGSSQGTQPPNTKPEHPGWQFLSFQSDAKQVTYYHTTTERREGNLNNCKNL